MDRAQDRLVPWRCRRTREPQIHMPTINGAAAYLVLGVGSVLVCASLVGMALKLRIAHGQRNPALENLNDRIRAWWWIAALFGIALTGGTAGTCGLFAFASLLAMREFTGASSTSKSEQTLYATMLYLVVPLQYLAILTSTYVLFALMIPFISLALLLAGLTGVARVSWEYARRIAIGLLVCVYFLSHVPALMLLERTLGLDARYLVVFIVIVVQASDVLQYLWGKLAGRRRIAPAISPSKTVAGTVGGIASAGVLGAMLSPITPFGAVPALSISLVLAGLGFGGGLALSALKRRRGIKDWGAVIPGHGGALDRVDSLCFAAPVFFYLLWLGVLP